MQLSIIPPTSLNHLRYYTNLTLTLPHLLEDPVQADSFRALHSYKILDNGTAEGYHYTPSDLVQMAIGLDVDEVVMPDALGDCETTIENVGAFRPYAEALHEAGIRCMGVVQGQTTSEVLKCLNFLRFCGYCDIYAAPRILCKFMGKMARHNLLQAMSEDPEYKDLQFHCLGASSWIKECVLLCDLPNVRSMDTSMPVVMGLEGLSIRTDEYVPRQENYFDLPRPSDFIQRVIEDNVDTYIDWCGATAGKKAS